MQGTRMRAKGAETRSRPVKMYSETQQHQLSFRPKVTRFNNGKRPSAPR